MEDFQLDAADLRLLDLLQTDASRSNQDLAALAHVSPPTALRRIKRLRALGLIERQVALLSPDRMAQHMGHGLTAVVEITLERQGSEHLDAFEQRLLDQPAVQQCYRVSPGPDFILVVHTSDMPGHLQLAQALFTSQANVRNVKSFFSLRRSKFQPRISLEPATNAAPTSRI